MRRPNRTCARICLPAIEANAQLPQQHQSGIKRRRAFHPCFRRFIPGLFQAAHYNFLLGKPLVGDHMGQAFVDLQERLQHFRPSHANNHQDFLDYAENQGYRDLVECTDYALASLFYAEHYKLRDTWVDAFAHCVGMSESLVLSPEYVVCILSSDRG